MLVGEFLATLFTTSTVFVMEMPVVLAPAA